MKVEIRKRILAARKEITPAQIGLWSKKIVERMAAYPSAEAADIVFVYMPIGKEVDITPLFPILWERGQQVAVPVCIPDQPGIMKAALLLPEMLSSMAKGMMNIPEPPVKRFIQPEEIGLVFAPGVAFDKQGGRIGYGAGYYDRFLPALRKSTPIVGVCFELQLVDNSFPSPHDIPMTAICTEKNTYLCNPFSIAN